MKDKYPVLLKSASRAKMCILSRVSYTNECSSRVGGRSVLIKSKLHLLLHLLAVVFNLISSLDDFIRSAVQLVRDDSLEVLENNNEMGYVLHKHVDQLLSHHHAACSWPDIKVHE